MARKTSILILTLAVLVTAGCRDNEASDQSHPTEQIQPVETTRAETTIEVIEPPMSPYERKRKQDLELAEKMLASEMEKALAPVEGIRGAAVKEVGRHEVIVAGSQVRMAQQSVSKLWVSMTIAEKVAKGDMTYLDPVTVTINDRAIFHQPLARKVMNGPVQTNIGELMVDAITKSDNMANQVLLDKAGGPAAVQNWINRHDPGIGFSLGDRIMQTAISGLEWNPAYGDRLAFERARNAVPDSIRSQRFMAYAQNPIDGASPVQIVNALGKMYLGEQPGAQDVIGLMSITKTGHARLKAGIPEGWRLMHKTGTGPTWSGRRAGFNDVGLMRSPHGRTYAVAVMIGNSASQDRTMQQAIANIARAVALYDQKTTECCVLQL